MRGSRLWAQIYPIVRVLYIIIVAELKFSQLYSSSQYNIVSKTNPAEVVVVVYIRLRLCEDIIIFCRPRYTSERARARVSSSCHPSINHSRTFINKIYRESWRKRARERERADWQAHSRIIILRETPKFISCSLCMCVCVWFPFAISTVFRICIKLDSRQPALLTRGQKTHRLLSHRDIVISHARCVSIFAFFPAQH